MALEFNWDSINNAVTVTTSTASAAHPTYYLLDYNLHTYWESTTTSIAYIDADYGAAVSKSADTATIYHYLAGNTIVQMYYSNNGTDWELAGDPVQIVTANTPICRIYLDATWNARYFRFYFYNMGANKAKVALAYLGLNSKINYRYSYGSLVKEKDYGGTDIVESLGGIRATRNFRAMRRIWRLKYEAVLASGADPDTADWDEIFAGTQGKRYPLFLYDDDSASYLVRLMQDRLDKIETAYNIYNIGSVSFEQEL